jgi:FkbM family methyltransferase
LGSSAKKSRESIKIKMKTMSSEHQAPEHADGDTARAALREDHWRRLVRSLVPRKVRNLVRRPKATAAWLAQELAYRSGRTVGGPLREDWAPRFHPASVAIYRAQRDDEDQRLELAGFVERCRPGMIFYDIGASHGVFTLAALRYGGPRTRVVAVDPSPTSNRLLRINLRLSGVEGQVNLIEAAIGAEQGTLTMLTTGPSGDHYLVGTDEDRPDALRIPQFTLPGLVERAGGLEPTHLKIDVEGFETEVLQGAISLLRQIQPELFLELHNAMIRARGRDPLDVLALLADCGYTRLLWRGQPISQDEALAKDITRLVCLPANPKV